MVTKTLPAKTTTKCDRCGTTMEDASGIRLKGKRGYRAWDGLVSGGDMTLDLCGPCGVDFDCWLRKGERHAQDRP